jgi:hypothetical protein
MKTLTLVAISLAVVASSNAFAQSKTGAEAYRKPIDTRQNGLNGAGKVPRGMSSTTAN